MSRRVMTIPLWGFSIAVALGISGCSDQRPQNTGEERQLSSRIESGSEYNSDIRFDTDHVKLPDASAFSDVLGEDLSAKLEGKATSFDVYDIGKLELTTGKIVACDGFSLNGVPFEKVVPPGHYPVLIALANIDDNYQRIAFARVQFAETPAVRWSMALLPGQDASTLKRDHIFGYGVDSGTGAFVDHAVLQDLEKVLSNDDDGFYKLLSKEMHKVYRDTRDWARIKTPHGNAVIFSSGFGDGCYASYFGYDTDGNLSALLTDFTVIFWDP